MNSCRHTTAHAVDKLQRALHQTYSPGCNISLVAAHPSGDAVLRVTDIAERFEIAKSTVRAYHARGEMPAADGYDKTGPWWWESTIAGWDRPGPGRRRKQH